MRRPPRCAGLAAGAVLVLLHSAPAVAAEPGIAVAERRDETGSQIVRLGLNGTAVPLTASWERAGRPKISHDGRLVAYQRPTPTGSEIWAMRPDGSEQRQVTRLGGIATNPAPAPNGSGIAFSFQATLASAPQIYTIDPSGGPTQRLTWGGRASSEPDYGPDHRIVYTAWPTNAAQGLPRVFVMNGNGTGKRKLAALPARRPSFSPDGLRVAFEVVEQPGHAAWDPLPRNPGFRIGTVREDAGALWRETFMDERIWHAHPTWAPDSRRLLIRSMWIGFAWTLGIVTPGGSGAGPLTPVSPDGPEQYGYPDWSPAVEPPNAG